MDGNEFDRLAKALATSSARRQALRAALAGIFAMAAASLWQETEAGRKNRRRKKKDKKKDDDTNPAPSPNPGPPPNPGGGLFNSCEFNSDCCSSCGLICANNDKSIGCPGPVRFCCGDIGAPCAQDCDCCGEVLCFANGCGTL